MWLLIGPHSFCMLRTDFFETEFARFQVCREDAEGVILVNRRSRVSFVVTVQRPEWPGC
jgi:hypothetical protein